VTLPELSEAQERALAAVCQNYLKITRWALNEELGTAWLARDELMRRREVCARIVEAVG
jgi:hypothetical protein